MTQEELWAVDILPVPREIPDPSGKEKAVLPQSWERMQQRFFCDWPGWGVDQGWPLSSGAVTGGH